MNNKERHERRYQRRKEKRNRKKLSDTINADNFDKVFTYDHLYHSYLQCRKNVRWKASVQKYISDAPMFVYETLHQLESGTFKSTGFHEFNIFERGKERHIRSVAINERVVQRCFCDYSLVPAVRRFLIHDNGASLKGKGYSFAINRFERHMMWFYRKYGTEGYVLQFDFKGYFDNIPHDLLRDILKKTYTDDRLFKLGMHFIDMFGDVGIGLGSQVSQVMALAAANKLDHFIKEELHIKCYGRYMDDGYLIHKDKAYLMYCLKRIEEMCEKLGLILSTKKTKITPIRGNITWLKITYSLKNNGQLVKRIWHNSVVRMRRKLKKFRRMADRDIMSERDVMASLSSWIGHTKHLNAYKTVQSMKRLYDMLFGSKGTEVYV